MCRSGNVVSMVVEHSDAVHVCKLSPEQPGWSASLLPGAHGFQKIHLPQLALHHMLLELNFIVPAQRQSDKKIT